MNWIAKTGISAALLAGAGRCGAEAGCGAVKVAAAAETGPGEIPLADRLPPGVCADAEIYRVAPLAGPSGIGKETSHGDLTGLKFPGRILVRRAAERKTERKTKSCAEIEGFLAASPAALRPDRDRGLGPLNCAAALAVPQDARLELTGSRWNAALQRWDFSLRCARPPECVPFLVWARGVAGAEGVEPYSSARTLRPPPASTKASERAPLVKRGDTAMLTWDEGGIRVVLPVTCLEAGAAGEFVQVRLQNAGRILRAEVVSAAAVRVSL